MTDKEITAFHEKTANALSSILQAYEPISTEMLKLTTTLININIDMRNLLYIIKSGDSRDENDLS